MYPSGNANADLGYNKHAHAHGLGHGQNQFLTQPPPPPPHFALPTGGPLNPLVTPSLPLAMPGGTGIDWAQLAQQWIHMRDAGVVMPPVAPPPPIIGNVPEFHHQAIALPLPIIAAQPTHPHLEEHGEADMDMDEEPERGNGAETPPPPAPVVTQSQWLAASEAAASDPTSVPTNLGPSGVAAMHGKQPWNSWQSGKQANPTAHIPSLLKLNVSNPNEPQQQLQMKMPLQPPQQQQQILAHQQQQQPQNHQQESDASGSASTEIDANKRKMLPAWIREGLEKMEREKQRQLERQQLSAPTPDVDGIDVKQVSSKTLTTPVNLLNIANVASDSEDSVGLPEDTLGNSREEQIGNEILSKARDSGSSDEEDEDNNSEPGQQETLTGMLSSAETKEAPVNGKNYEERLADLMLAVRRTLTEILLETTNEEIAAIASEALKAHRAKASSAQVIRKSALSSITGNLGLAAYASDSSSESEEDEDNAEGDRQADAVKDGDKSVHLSAEDLKARIRRSKRSFERVIDDIENRMAQQKERDEKTLQRHRRRELADSASERRSPVVNEELLEDQASYPAHDKLQHFNAGKRPSRKERTTRFSDNKDGKHQPHSYVHQVVAAAAVSPPSRVVAGAVPQKLKPVPNPATNLLQMPESVTTMLNAADKALQNANKASSKAKSSRRRSSSASSSSSSSDSSSSDSDSSSSDSKTSSNRSKRSSRHGHSDRGSSRSKYDRRDRDRKKEQNRDRDRDRDRDRRQRHHYSGGSSSSRKSDRRNRDSSRSQEDDRGSNSQHRSSRHRSSRSHDHGSSSSSKRRSYRSRSRSKSRSTHHSHSNSKSHSSSSASHSRKRH